MTARFLQLHVITSYPASLLNRDDAGFAKRIPFGGVTRTRISSQCLKRHWRTFRGTHSIGDLGVDLAVRSRLTFERYVVEPLIEEGLPPALVRGVTRELMSEVLGQSAKARAESDNDGSDGSEGEGTGDNAAKKGKDGKAPAVHTNQVTVLGRPEIEWLLGEARAVCTAQPDPKKLADAVKARMGGEGRKNLAALHKAASGLDAAMFGRMVTSDILSRGDAAVHVAHSFTVHEEQAESDYFSAVDDLLQGDEGGQLGSGHINSTELTSGVFYTYLAVDIPLLVSNLEGCARKDWKTVDRSLAAKVLDCLVHLVATVSPGAKVGSTAPHAYAHLVLAEMSDAQPRTLANAFLRPVGVRSDRPDLLANTYQALADHITEMDKMYGRTGMRRLAAIGLTANLVSAAVVTDTVPLADLASWVAEEVNDARRAVAAL